MIEGKLVWNGKLLQVRYKSKKGKDTTGSPKQEVLSSLIRQKLEENPSGLHEQPVEIQLGANGQPAQICLKGESEATAEVKETGDFHNPYNFVPALPRQGKVVGTELGDLSPVGHYAYLPNYWSGTITVRLKTATPLLIPDAGRLAVGDNPEHKIFPLRMLDGKPYLSPTSIKGILRSAYEAVTNSRLSVFTGHEDRLAYRVPTDNSKRIYPAIVIQQDEGKRVLKILEAPDVLGDVGRLPRYKKNPASTERDKGASSMSLTYYGTRNIPKSGDPVWVRLNPGNQYDKELPRNIRDNLPGEQILNNVVTLIHLHRNGSEPPVGEDWRKGWVYISGANINGKIYERIFLEPENHQNSPQIVINQAIDKLWRELIHNYQKTHEKAIKKREQEGISLEDYLGKEPGQTGYSKHIYTAEAKELTPGTFCYVELKRQPNSSSLNANDVVALSPVTISRRLYQLPPKEFLDQSLKPAQTLDELSPADRVFGWVKQKQEDSVNNQGSYKGQLRIHEVKCETPEKDAIQPFDAPLPLAILGAPKPEQARFYLAKDKQGAPLADKTPKEQGYQEISQGLRGRKVYPHHRSLPEGYWERPWQDRTQELKNGHYQEYRRPKKKTSRGEKEEQRDSQNRSVLAWVKSGTEFSLKIDVINLSDIELGALLYLLQLPSEHYHRLGAGKPLGFGSVRLEIVATSLRRGTDWQEFYQSLLPLPEQKIDLEEFITAFKTAVESAGYGNKFEKVPFIEAFMQAAKGFNNPIHYPRITPQPEPEGEAFKWFVQNEQGIPADRQRGTPRRDGKRLALSRLVSGDGLPLNPTNEQNQPPQP
jgi:CRISPR-associated protein (TIGR03986 family)